MNRADSTKQEKPGLEKPKQVNEELDLLENTARALEASIDLLTAKLMPIVYCDVKHALEEEKQPDRPACDLATKLRTIRELILVQIYFIRKLEHDVQI